MRKLDLFWDRNKSKGKREEPPTRFIYNGRSPSDRDFEIRDAARTLVRAEEIKADKSLNKLVNKELNKRRDALAKLKVPRKKKKNKR